MCSGMYVYDVRVPGSQGLRVWGQGSKVRGLVYSGNRLVGWLVMHVYVSCVCVCFEEETETERVLFSEGFRAEFYTT